MRANAPLTSSSAQAIDGLEALVLSFLEQLANGLSDREGSSKKNGKTKIQIDLVDRRRLAEDGYVHPQILGTELTLAQNDADARSDLSTKDETSERTGTRSDCITQARDVSPYFFHVAAQLLTVADMMHEALTDDIPTTKRCILAGSHSQRHVADARSRRDIYYKDPTLFKTQSTVDKVSPPIYAHQKGADALAARGRHRGDAMRGACGSQRRTSPPFDNVGNV